MDTITADERRLIDKAIAEGRVTVLPAGCENEYAPMKPQAKINAFFANKARGARLRRATGEKRTEAPCDWHAIRAVECREAAHSAKSRENDTGQRTWGERQKANVCADGSNGKG